MKKLVFSTLIILSFITACHNQDWEFPDYDYTTVYFSYQTPVRTLVLGEDIYNNTLDNAHQCKIIATMGGVYENKTERILDVTVDNSLCDNLKFESDSGNYVLAMPTEYYTLPEEKIVIPSGSLTGGIEVQLTDAFFADARSTINSFVIPLRITSVANVDSVLSGEKAVSDPNRLVASDWAIEPKDYVLYCVKYVNPWHGSYLRRGQDVGKGNTGNNELDTTIVYQNEYVERDQVVSISTVSMDEVSLLLTTRNKGNETDIPFEIRVKIGNDGKCIVSAPDKATYTVTGNGDFIKDGDSWGDKTRDVMHLKYDIDFRTTTHTISDTLVMRDRQVKFETFFPVKL